MQWDDLMKTAGDLVAGGGKSRRPRQSSLRRAVSTVYYAMFHCLANCCATELVGGPGANRSKPAWRQVYRALEHGFVKEKCRDKNFLSKFPQEVEDFANAFVWLQEKRHAADYDPAARFTKLEVESDIAEVKTTIEGFLSVGRKHRRAFVVYVLFKTRANP